MIEADNITKTYRTGIIFKNYTQALTGVSLRINEGEIFGILGPNGAGKTTLQNIFSSLLIPDTGRLIIDGIDVSRHYPVSLKKKINMSSGNPNFPWSLTVYENLTFYGMLYGLKGSQLRAKVNALIDMFELRDSSKKRFDELSTGNKQRLSLAKSLINDPILLLLDEPTVGLDPDVASRIRKFILDIHRQRKMTIILTTHYMAEAEMMCKQIAFISRGSLKALGTADELKKQTSKNSLEGAFIELAK